MPTPEHIEALAQRINQNNLGCCIDCNAHARGKGIEHINDIEQARDIAADILTGTDFRLPAHEAIWDAITYLHFNGDPVDTLTVADHLDPKTLRRQSDVLTPPPAQVAAECSGAVHPWGSRGCCRVVAPAQVAASVPPAASGATESVSVSPSAWGVLSEAERALVALRALLADGATPGPWLLDGPWWHGRDEAVPLVVTTEMATRLGLVRIAGPGSNGRTWETYGTPWQEVPDGDA